jgi:hypothetical protein
MNMPVGGRGKKAPYKTVVVRVPEPIAETVEQLANNYRDAVINGQSTDEFIKVMTDDECYRNSLRKDDVIAAMTDVLRMKKGTKVSFDKLLQVLFPD